jgi:hypothetical protein
LFVFNEHGPASWKDVIELVGWVAMSIRGSAVDELKLDDLLEVALLQRSGEFVGREQLPDGHGVVEQDPSNIADRPNVHVWLSSQIGSDWLRLAKPPWTFHTRHPEVALLTTAIVALIA